MRILETHAKSEKEALDLVSDYLEANPAELEIKLYQKGSSGFLGFGQKTPSLYHVYAVLGTTRFPVVVKGVLSSLLRKMGYKARMKQMWQTEDGKFYVEMSSSHAGHIIGKGGRTLEALQFILNLLVEKYHGEPPRILLDIGGYREKRASYLENLAQRTAQGVSKSGRSRLLNPLNPYERRLVHLTLQEDERVHTESEGEGVYKRIRVLPQNVAQGTEDSEYEHESISAESLADDDPHLSE